MRFRLAVLCIFFIGWSLRLRPCLCDSSEDESGTCSEFSCGNVTNLSYPFWTSNQSRNCGRQELELNCHGDDYTDYFTMKIDDLDYRVLSIDKFNRTMKIARSDLYDSPCPENFSDTTLNYLLNYSPNIQNLTVFYKCHSESLKSNKNLSRNRFDCASYDGGTDNYFFANESIIERWKSELRNCEKIITVPAFSEAEDEIENGTEVITNAFHGGFPVTYETLNITSACNACENSGGSCGSNSSFPFLCSCSGQIPHPFIVVCTAPAADKKKVTNKIIIGVCSGVGGIFMMCLVFFIWEYRKNKKSIDSAAAFRSLSSYFSSKKSVEKESIYVGVHLFSYTELEAATNKFDSAKELGDGGFGTVYYGKLQDGRAVAVKRLYENNYKRVEQFRNEVEILTRLRHKNLVSLYGCTSRECRELMLVYEYISNGTVADHLHGERAKPGELPWLTRMKIAIETASALVYLHASDVIHRDIKTSNILLDNNYNVKVADFGLSRPFPTDVSHITTAPQGTPGYLDPEYNECYQLTEKSDVYSFGVVLVELISSKPAVDITRHRHEIKLSTMAINKIQNSALNELVDPHLGFETDERVRKMISAVAELAFQCLQSVKDTRPSMADILKTLNCIENEDCWKEKAGDINVAASKELPKDVYENFSPDSVTVRWFSSMSSTANISS